MAGTGDAIKDLVSGGTVAGVEQRLPGGPPPWEARLQRAAYRSPSGAEIAFDYEDVSREYDKRTVAFEFPGVDGAYVQDNGVGARRYPLRCFFSGLDHDILAAKFELALLERGVGTLQHPRYGTFDVVPFGTIARRDDLKTAANQAVVETTFFTALRELYPAAQTSPRSEIQASLDGFVAAAAGQFADKARLMDAVAKANVTAKIRDGLKLVQSKLEAVSNVTAAARRDFADQQRLVNDGMSVLIGQPLLLAQQICNLVMAPGRALTGLAQRLDGYARLLDSIISAAGTAATSIIPGIPGTQVQLAGLRLRNSNEFHTSDLFAMAAVAGSAVSVLENTFATRPAALAAAESVLAALDQVVAWRDSRFDALEQADTGESYQALQRVVALIAGLLVEASFTLLTERRIVLDRDRTIIDLAAEIYGSVDDKLDELINNNDLTGSEILELSKGRTILYYV